MRNFLLAALLLPACGVVKDVGDRLCTAKPDRRVVLPPQTQFSERVHPILVKNCLPCHTTGGAMASSPFADAEINRAYSVAKGRMDFSNFKNGQLWKKGTSKDHYADALKVSPGQDQFAAILEAWSKSERPGTPSLDCEEIAGSSPDNKTNSETPPPVIIKTVSISLPSLPPLAGAAASSKPFQYIRLPLDPFGHVGSILELGIRRFSDATETSAGFIQVGEPRVLAKGYNIRMTGMVIHVTNGSVDHTNNSYLLLNYVVAPPATQPDLSKMPLSLSAISTAKDIIELTQGSGELKVQFSVLEQTTDPASTPPATETEAQQFTRAVAPILTRQCNSCHSGASAAATGAYNLSGSDAADRTATLAYVSRLNPSASALLVAGRDGTNHGGGVRLTVQADINEIINWISRTP